MSSKCSERLLILLPMVLTAVMLCSSRLLAQEYFQQEVNYTINVRLDNVDHQLDGFIEMEYINNSPDDLDKIFIHLWPNAYRDLNTAYSRDAMQRGMTRFYFSHDDERGYIDSLDFRVNDTKANWRLSEQHADIGMILLDDDLAAGDTLIISTPFRVQIPISFGRLGRTDQGYQITQWYPKPAVYDTQGWHPMPYLAVGEFYAEYGSYDVQITTPSNYLIAATGNSPEEYQQYKHAESSDHTHDDQMKTMRFQANNVHDFAWFANTDYIIEYQPAAQIDDVQLPEIYIYRTAEQSELWHDQSMEYTAASLHFFSERVGPYPYEKMTIVQNPDQAGGGMEYPMITSVDRVRDDYELDHVIAHEVGHQWFYGLLGTNEREHAWMDEGWTTYYDHRYFLERYGEDHFASYLPGFVKRHICRSAVCELYVAQASRHYDQGAGTEIDSLTTENYLIGAYAKPAAVLSYLESYIGVDRMDKFIQSFYIDWKYKHPRPNDLKKYLEKALGEPMDWLFELLLTDATVDYSISGYDAKTQKLTLTNRTNIAAPIRLQSWVKDSLVMDQWYPGEKNTFEWHLPKGDYTKMSVSVHDASIDVHLADNHYRPKAWLSKRHKMKLGIGIGPSDLSGRKTYLTPYAGYNVQDGLQLGLVNFSAFSPASKIQDVFVLGYGFGSASPVGSYRIRYNNYLNTSRPRHWHADLDMRSFSRATVNRTEDALRYFRISPSVQYHIKSSHISPWKHSFQLRSHIVGEQSPRFGDDGAIEIINHQSYVQQLDYNIRRPHGLYPYEFWSRAELSHYENSVQESFDYLKLESSFTVDLYYKPKKSVQFRFYGAGFLWNDQSDAGTTNPNLVKGSIPYAHQSFNDYYYEQYLVGRGTQEGLWSRQVMPYLGGGFKTATTSAFTSLGQSNNYLLAVNMSTDLPFTLPFNIPLKAFFDVAQYKGKPSADASFESRFIYSAGLALEFGDGLLGVYLPVFNSQEINLALDNRGTSALRQWSFALNLDKLRAWPLFDRFGW